MKRKPIREQVVVVVGATSGIGRLAALTFAERGARMVVAARSQPELDELAEEIRRRGGLAVPVACDVSEFGQVQAVADRAVEAFGRIDTWIHAAAVAVYARFEETLPEEFERVVDVNLLGQAYGAMAALPVMKRQRSGALLHISSVEGKRSLPLHSAYAASKHGMIGFLDALRLELKHDHIPVSVTTILPASINTPFFDKALTRLGVKPRPVPPVYQPDLVVDALLYAAEHPVREIVVGGAGKSLSLAQRLWPRLADAVLVRIGFAGQRSSQPKSQNAPNNLFNHQPGYDRVYGSFDQEARSFSLYTWMRTRPLARWGAGLALLGAAGVVSGRALLARRAARRRAWWKIAGATLAGLASRRMFR